MSNSSNQTSCSLCAGKGCVVTLFRRANSETKPLPGLVMCFLYGLPLIALFSGALLGSIYGELNSIIGAGLGLVGAFFIVRSCQRRLNSLCYRTPD